MEDVLIYYFKTTGVAAEMIKKDLEIKSIRIDPELCKIYGLHTAYSIGIVMYILTRIEKKVYLNIHSDSLRALGMTPQKFYFCIHNYLRTTKDESLFDVTRINNKTCFVLRG